MMSFINNVLLPSTMFYNLLKPSTIFYNFLQLFNFFILFSNISIYFLYIFVRYLLYNIFVSRIYNYYIQYARVIIELLLHNMYYRLVYKVNFDLLYSTSHCFAYYHHFWSFSSDSFYSTQKILVSMFSKLNCNCTL